MLDRPDEAGGESEDDHANVPAGFKRHVGTLTISEMGRFGDGAWTVYWMRDGNAPPSCSLEVPSAGIEFQYTAGQRYFVFTFEGVDGLAEKARAAGVRVTFDGRATLIAEPARDPHSSAVYIDLSRIEAWGQGMLRARRMTVERIGSQVPDAPWQVEMDGAVPAIAALQNCASGLPVLRRGPPQPLTNSPTR